MHKPVPIIPDGSPSSFQIVPESYDSDLAKTVFSRLPIGEACDGDFVSWSLLPRPDCGYGEYNPASLWLAAPISHHIPYLRIDVVRPYSLYVVVPRQYCPASAPRVLNHAYSPRLRQETTGLHVRRRVYFVSSHFFPRSVGFAPTDSSASGAFPVAPSILCHCQAMPSISSYSTKPLRQSLVNTPCLAHSRKYLCTALALPNSSLGRAFHWHPVRNTYMMAENAWRGAIRFRPPPGRRQYLRPFSRLAIGIRGSTRCHNSSDIVHDFMHKIIPQMLHKMQYTIYG